MEKPNILRSVIEEAKDNNVDGVLPTAYFLRALKNIMANYRMEMMDLQLEEPLKEWFLSDGVENG